MLYFRLRAVEYSTLYKVWRAVCNANSGRAQWAAGANKPGAIADNARSPRLLAAAQALADPLATLLCWRTDNPPPRKLAGAGFVSHFPLFRPLSSRLLFLTTIYSRLPFLFLHPHIIPFSDYRNSRLELTHHYTFLSAVSLFDAVPSLRSYGPIACRSPNVPKPNPHHSLGQQSTPPVRLC